MGLGFPFFLGRRFEILQGIYSCIGPGRDSGSGIYSGIGSDSLTLGSGKASGTFLGIDSGP